MRLLCFTLFFLIQLTIKQQVFAQHENELIHESSPYLLQHSNNPVNWYPWGEKALNKAEEEDKPLIISIGYAACHWCHVMEKEAFQDTAIARFMNENFVSIKVDREERPDIDQLYVDASRIISGNVGWPLNAIALPDGKPFYVVSYLPKDKWLKTLEIFANGYKNEKAKIVEQAAMITEGVKDYSYINVAPVEQKFSMNILKQMYAGMQSKFDLQYGRIKGEPKFPMPVTLNYLLEYFHATQDKTVLNYTVNTLDNLALGGIYDHLGGGFSRYAVDDAWQVPHFEKMLYDNALMVSLFTDAYKVTEKDLYKNVIEETLAFVQNELMDTKTGLFYSSISADSEGEEGKFYTWTQDEIQQALGNNATTFSGYFQVEDAGNWERGQNILRILPEVYQPETSEKFKEAKKLLFKLREQREKPEVDDKLLTSWNALMIDAFAGAYRTFGNETYLKVAEKNANFLMNQFSEDHQLLRNYKKGKVVPAFLDDYAYLIKSLITLYQATFDEQYLKWSWELTAYVKSHFKDEDSGLFYYTQKEAEGLVSKKMELVDNILPASNGVMCKNLQLLGWYFGEDSFQAEAEKMISHIVTDMMENGVFYSSWASTALWLVEEPFEVAIVGENYQSVRSKWDQEYHPNIIFFGGDKEGELPFMQYKLVEDETNIYVCRNKICNKPVKELIQAKQMIK